MIIKKIKNAGAADGNIQHIFGKLLQLQTHNKNFQSHKSLS